MKSKFTIYVIVLSFIISIRSNAQSFSKGQNTLSLGYGLGSILESEGESHSKDYYYHNSIIGPFHLKFEHAVNPKIGFGFSAGIVNHKIDWADDPKYTYHYNYHENYTLTSFILRINWHFGDENRFDPYWGLAIGYQHYDWDVTSNAPDYSYSYFTGGTPFGFEITIGARYFVTSKISAYMEGGIALSAIQGGVCYKF